MDLKDLLSVLVSHDSVFGNEKSLAEWVVWYLNKQGFDTEKLATSHNLFNVLAQRGRSKPKLLCYGHLDTVPVYQGWETDPFSLTERGDKLYGLGACDMKGGIATMLYAIERLPKDTPIKIFLAVDEENDSAGSWTLVQKKPEWLQGVTHMISAEPGASATKIGGSDVLTLGRRGRGRFVVRITGYSAHGGHTDRGVSAVSLAAEVIKQVEALKPASHQHLGQGSHFVAKVDGAAKGLSIPEYCEVEIDRHLVLPETVQSALNQYQKICNKILADITLPVGVKKFVSIKVEVKKRRHKYMEPFETPRSDVVVKQAEKIMASLHNKVVLNYGRSVGDENIFANELSINPLIFGPHGGNIHSPNEWVSYTSMKKCAQFYKQLIEAIN